MILKMMFGSWKHSASHPQTYKAQIEDDGYVRIEKCAEGARGGTIVHLRRLHSVHPANNSFKRLIAFLSGIQLKCITTTYDIAVGLCAIVYYKQYC